MTEDLKKQIVDYLKDLTDQLTQRVLLREPDGISDKAVYAAFLNLHNCVVGVTRERDAAEQKTRELGGKIEDLTRTLNHMENENFHQV